MGLIHGQMPTHQGQHPSEHHGLQFDAVAVQQRSPRQLFGIFGGVDPADQTDRPVLQRLGDRGNRVVAHDIG